MLQTFVNWFVASVLRLAPETRLASSISFFLEDSIKIILLLAVMTFLMSLLRYYFPIEKIRDFLGSHKMYGLDYLLATLFGAITPFCTCSSIPLFIGFLGAGIPLGVTFAFLITSPLINEVAVAMFIGLFGWKVAMLYVISGLLIGIVGGYLIGQLKFERYVEKFVLGNNKHLDHHAAGHQENVLKSVSKEAWDIVKQVTPYVLFGVGLGAVIHGFVPEGFFERYVSKDNPLAVPMAVLLGVPLYSSAHTVFPVIQSLVGKGVPLGTALAFMMATVGLSLPEALILKKVIKLPLLLAFFGIVSAGMILIGYVLNLVL